MFSINKALIPKNVKPAIPKTSPVYQYMLMKEPSIAMKLPMNREVVTIRITKSFPMFCFKVPCMLIEGIPSPNKMGITKYQSVK